MISVIQVHLGQFDIYIYIYIYDSTCVVKYKSAIFRFSVLDGTFRRRLIFYLSICIIKFIVICLHCILVFITGAHVIIAN